MRRDNISEGPPTHLLLVEGAEDFHFLGHLQTFYGLDKRFRRQDGKGVENLLGDILPRLLRPPTELDFVGVVVDADADVQARWNAVSYVLTQAGYANVPTTPNALGAIIAQEGLPTVGVWLMPDNVTAGALEEFAIALIKSDDQLLLNRAEQAVAAIPEAERRFAPQHTTKATVHTWLAWQEEPDSALGQGVTKRYFDANAAPAQAFMDWVKRLFQL